MVLTNDKEKFVYTGETEDFTVKWYNMNRMAVTENGWFKAVISAPGVGRINGVFRTPMEAVEHAKKSILVKSEKGQRKYAHGRAEVYLYDRKTRDEFLAATLQKDVKRYYEPVSRFDHSRGD